MPEGRPIVSDCGSESYRVSKFIDSYIRPISIKHPAYIKDTYDFIEKIRDQKIPADAVLVTCDVTSLYTNMDIDRTISVARAALDSYSNDKNLNKYLIELLSITLKNNDFSFNDEYFLQTCGTAMGKTYAPGLADLYMQEFDFQACQHFKIKPLLYFRFLDDVIFAWPGSVLELLEFQDFLNSLISGIKITFTHSERQVNFLDTTVYKSHFNENECNLSTKVYFKETDTHQLLHKSSFHPKHTFTGVLKSQLLRFKRISSSYNDYYETCKILFTALAKRNYSKRLLRKMRLDIWKSDDRKPNQTEKQAEILPIVVPYSDVGTRLAKQWKEVIKENNTFDKYRPITAYCNGPNLYKKLVRSSLSDATCTRPTTPTESSGLIGAVRCNNVRCKACDYMVAGNVFKSSSNNRTFKLKDSFNCKSSSLVYLINCKRCFQQYVGQTGRTLAHRINQHLTCIRTKQNSPVGLHFNLPNHSIQDFSILAIDLIEDNRNALKTRLMKETNWQNLLQTAYPFGINNCQAFVKFL